MSPADRKVWDDHEAVTRRRRNTIPESMRRKPLPTQASLDALHDLAAAVDGTHLREVLAKYEATGDHNHGWGRIAPGGPCGHGKDCWVARARRVLAILEAE